MKSVSLLQSWWFYPALSALVVLLYVWWPHPESVTTSSAVPSSAPAFWDQPLDPQRVLQAFQQKPHLVLWLGFWTTVGTGLAVAGGLISGWLIWTGRVGQWLRAPSRLRTSWSFWDVGRIIWLVVLLAGLFPLAQLSLSTAGVPFATDERLWSVVAMLMLDGLVVAAVWALAAGKTPAPGAWLGLSWQQGSRAIGGALARYVVWFPWIVGLLWLVATAARRFGIEPSMEVIHELLFVEARTLTVALTVVLACVVGPVAEEVFFRGVVFTTLRRSTSRVVALLASSSLFAAMHTNLIGFLPIVALGCVLADLYERSGSLWGAIVVHMVHNTLLVGLGLTARELLWVQ